MPLFWFLLVIVSLSCGFSSLVDLDPETSIVATVGLCLCWGLLSKWVAISALFQMQRTSPEGLKEILEQFERRIEALRWLGLGAIVLCMVGFGYARFIDSLSICQASMGLRACLLLMPGLTIVGFTWWADHQFGVANELVPGGFWCASMELWNRFRTQAAWLVFPVVLMLGVLDLVKQIPGAGGYLANAILGLTMLLGMVLGLPFLIRFIWKLKPMNTGPTDQFLVDVTRSLGFERLKLMRWDTGSRTCNAMVAGFVPGFRMLVLSDGLLTRLSSQQLSMIILHELAHLRRWHVPIRMAVIVPPWGIAALIFWVMGDSAVAQVIAAASSIVLTLLLLRIVAHRTELDADTIACQMALEVTDRFVAIPKSEEEAALVMADALRVVTADNPAARRGTWLHPGVEDRCNALRRSTNARRDAKSFGSPVRMTQQVDPLSS